MRPIVLGASGLVAVVAVGLALRPAGAVRRAQPELPADLAAITATATPLRTDGTCTGRFTTLDLPHTTTLDGEHVGQFDSNGAGVAAGDLDGDGLPDLVLANLDGPSTILWNRGDLAFEPQTLEDRSVRGVALVDTDDDGRRDIVMTHRGAGVSVWRNTGVPGADRFERTSLPGVTRPAYSMLWADLGGDAALDIVTASYDADLDRELGSSFLFSDGAGVIVHTRDGDRYTAERLAPHAQTLAMAAIDLDGDGRRDLVTGNDFTVPDRAWLRTADGWTETRPFERTTENTMGLVETDVDNDGITELFATDMKPYRSDPDTFAKWLPVMAAMPQVHAPDDPQRPVNAFQVRTDDGGWKEVAVQHGLDATGWSWSSRFGDLDRDGFVDLYVANGMIDDELFGYLAGGELVEENQVLRNQGDGTFARELAWGMGSSSSGRGMTLVDLDLDGRLDAVVNNLLKPAQLLRNDLCGGDAIEVDLRQPGRPNTFAVGATVTLWTDRGGFDRTVTATSGYLSGDPTTLHVGFPAGTQLQRLDIRWPDGSTSVIPAPVAGSRVEVSRS